MPVKKQIRSASTTSILLICGSLLLASQQVFGITWYLKDVTFYSGATASGSFDFDAATSTYSNFDITILNSPAHGPSNSYGEVLPSSGGSDVFLLTVAEIKADYTGVKKLSFVFTSPLTDAGGTVSIDAASVWSHHSNCTSSCNPAVPFEYVATGQVTTEVCNGQPVTVFIGNGEAPTLLDDVVLGTPGDDVIRGKAGNDTICSGGGNDFVHGNSGDDWIDGGDGVDNIRGGQGNDVIYTGVGATAGTSSSAFGGYGDDEINGGADADDLRGGRGIDTINGNGGDDILYGNDNGDILDGGDGVDTVNGGSGNDDLRGGDDNDSLNGGRGNDVLDGGAGFSDVCDGGPSGGDTATASCEMVVNVP